MKLLSLNFKNFRNLENKRIDFDGETTVLTGNNAQGKTNILEGIYFISTGRPIKSDTEEEVMTFGDQVVSVDGIIEGRDEEELKLSTVIVKSEDGLRKKLLVNDIPRRLVDYGGNLIVVFFKPEDIYLITGSPSGRRDYIDSAISQVDKDYRKNLNAYQKVVTQKNRLLKSIREGLSKIDELDFWNQRQLELGKELQIKRRAFFEKINSFEKILGEFEYKYLENLISEVRLEELKQREVYAAMSLAGPHRDDFSFSEDEKDLAKYGSRGEQRTAVLDLKIAELSYIEEETGERPVLLLDDIFSELDESHREHVLSLAKLQQTIIASVEYDDYLKKKLEGSQIFYVKNGVISKLAVSTFKA